MTRAWQALKCVGSLSVAVAAVSAGSLKAEDAAKPADASMAAKPAIAPIPDAITNKTATPPVASSPAAPSGELPRTYSSTPCRNCAANAAGAGMTTVPGVGTPGVVGVYQPGHIHGGGLSHLFWYSGYHPFLDQLHSPMKNTVFNGGYASYYAGYRTVYSPNWHEVYVPRYNVPTTGYSDPYGPSYYGYGQTRSTFYAPNLNAPNPNGPVNTPVPPSPPTGYHYSGFRYTGEPGIYSPYGVGSSTYFGTYGSAGY